MRDAVLIFDLSHRSPRTVSRFVEDARTHIREPSDPERASLIREEYPEPRAESPSINFLGPRSLSAAAAATFGY